MMNLVSDYIELKTEMLQVLTPEQAWHYLILPKAIGNDTIEFYIDEKNCNDSIQEELEMLFAKKIVLHELSSLMVNKTLGVYYRQRDKSRNKNIQSGLDFKSEDFIENLIIEANTNGASDIHIETYEDRCRIRLRVDGKLLERYIIPLKEYPVIINKIKIKSNLDIAEKRLPQDGRIFFQKNDQQFDIRVSVLPTLYGEKVVLRLLSKDATNIDINTLGFSSLQLADYMEGIRKPNGIVLISGPTGSGKTTTLYATLKVLNKEHTNILTIEDPIEYTLEGINQVQLKEDIGLSFARALRTFLRQDPDIIMLGEIRDNETAQMAIRAALTGHLVLSTIHTNSAWGTISRLIDMNVPPFLLASTLNLSVAQRLIRLLCNDCKKEETFNPSLYPRNYKPSENISTHYKAVGCEKCFYTGYKGRTAVYEVIPVGLELSESIKKNLFTIQEYLVKENIKLLHHSAFELFKKGNTTLDEIYPILYNRNE